jgi:hypothetical protein
MTIEHSGLAALRAADVGDLDSLRAAIDARETALAELKTLPPSTDSFQRLATALEVGDAIRGAVRAFKLRVASENSRLSQIQTYLGNSSLRNS